MFKSFVLLKVATVVQRKARVRIFVLAATLGPEMAVLIFWAPRIFMFFLKTSTPIKFLVWAGGGIWVFLGVGRGADVFLWAQGFFWVVVTRASDTLQSDHNSLLCHVLLYFVLLYFCFMSMSRHIEGFEPLNWQAL